MVDSALHAYHYFDRGLLIYSLSNNLSNNILRLDAMYGLYLVWFALSMPIDAYNTDRVYEVQPRSRPFTIAVDNYKKGTSYRYQIIGPSFYKVKAKCSVNVQFSGSACSPYDVFAYNDDGTNNLLDNKTATGCGKLDGVVIKSKYNSLTFGILSKYFGGTFSCEISINAHPEKECDCGWHINTKIFNGVRPVRNGMAPMAAFYSENVKGVFCGGCSITENFVLTSAHCLLSKPTNEVSKMWILVGRDDITISNPYDDTRYAFNYRVKTILPHEKYDANTFANDIGLARTVRRIAWNRGVAPVCMPSSSDTEKTYVGAMATYAGWGFTSFDGHQSPVLLSTSVKVLPIENCSKQLDDDSLTKKQLCTFGNGHDACQKDSGGPLLVLGQSILRYIAVGITSFGPLCGVKKPAVCTFVVPYLRWIESKTTPMQSYCLVHG